MGKLKVLCMPHHENINNKTSSWFLMLPACLPWVTCRGQVPSMSLEGRELCSRHSFAKNKLPVSRWGAGRWVAIALPWERNYRERNCIGDTYKYGCHFQKYLINKEPKPNQVLKSIKSLKSIHMREINHPTVFWQSQWFLCVVLTANVPV